MKKWLAVAGFTTIGCSALLGCSANGDGPRPSGAASAGAAGAMDAADPPGLDAPDEATALVAFVEAKQYANWAREAEFHPTSGPHGESVRVYYSPKAAQALASGAATFPIGAASVKELASDGSIDGYSVWVKVQAASDGGRGFFWYERVRHPGGADTVSGNERGSRDCVACHGLGRDYARSTLPFDVAPPDSD